MQRFLKRWQIWIAYFLFLALALNFGSREGLIGTDSPYAGGKLVLLIVYVAFLVFSLYATARANFFKTLAMMNSQLWGRQIGLDLYISVGLSLAVIYLVEGSLAITLLWALPILVFANLAILPYLLMNYAAVLAPFVG